MKNTKAVNRVWIKGEPMSVRAYTNLLYGSGMCRRAAVRRAQTIQRTQAGNLRYAVRVVGDLWALTTKERLILSAYFKGGRTCNDFDVLDARLKAAVDSARAEEFGSF